MADPSPLPPPDPLVGREIDGKYRVLSFVARGSMGKVYQAEQIPLGRTVALKILDPHEQHVAPSGSHAQRFLMEASILAKLSHPNTVRIYDYGVWDGRTYLVMEYIPGTTLKDALARGPLDPRRALRVGRQIAQSLSEAHQIGIVHRDLKPGNVLLTRIAGEDDVVKVVDFGLVKEVDGDLDMTGDGTMLGTPMYMAPEQIRGGHVDQRTDLYALGVVLYKAFTGETPFPAGTAATVLTSHMTVPAPSFAKVKPGLDLPRCIEWTVLTLLAKAPEERFSTAAELIVALGACEVALADPALQGLALRLEGGRCVVPPELETSWSTSRRPTSPPPAEPTESPVSPPARSLGIVAVAAMIVALLVGLGVAVALAAGAVGWGASRGAPASVTLPEAPSVAPAPVETAPARVEAPIAAPEPAPAEPPAPEERAAAPSRRAERPAAKATSATPAPPPPAASTPEPEPAADDFRKSDLKDPWAE